jgi:two-component sensor histidine kinase
MTASPEESESDQAPSLGKIRRHIRILIDLAKLAGETTTLERFLSQAAVQVARAVEVDHVKILGFRRRTADLFMEAGLGWQEGVVRSATFPADLRSPPGRCYQTAEPLVIEDTANAPSFVISDVLKQHGIVSLANVPILIDGAAWGVLEVDSSVRRNFSEDTIDFMMAAAAIMGPSIRREVSGRTDMESAAVAAAQVQMREILLREMQHRVKNNFQLILASITLQKRRFENADVHRVLDHVANRINAISLAHDQLSPREDTHSVEVASYLRALCASIEAQADNVAIELEAHEIELGIDRAVPLGLILNEAVTNSIKHAFGTEGGRVNVKLATGSRLGEARLTIADNGKGFQAAPSGRGSGHKLIAALARQLGGDIEQTSSAEGTVTSIVFPVIV